MHILVYNCYDRLSDGDIAVAVGGRKKSSSTPLLYRVSQGLILLPLLFNIYMKSHVVAGVQNYLNVDNIQLYIFTPSRKSVV